MTASTRLRAPTVALSCRGLKVAFRGREVLCGVDLELGAGEWLGLIGPNGAGKSTLLRSIAGLVAYDGTVALTDGRVPSARDLSLVPQTPLWPSGMTVAEYVLLGRTAHLSWLASESRSDRQVVASVLRRLSLEDFAERLVTNLSGGEAQRVVLARALAQQTRIILLDEPTSALDLGHQSAVLELVDELRRSDGLTVIAAMHDLSTAARFADRLVLINEGRLVADGEPDSVLDAGLLSSVYATQLTVRRLDSEIVVLPAPRTHRKHLDDQTGDRRTNDNSHDGNRQEST
ncbi:MAG: ABC transporter ATP-binding protein [Acidimicrobiaceae bacterium]|nr:ABC transporter ATP-binding protein [Acidimicrobiaceae bacterium]MXW60768.1 ABC transporter ATP-binding protein [Acidimicrobiaceae bacterium]MXW75192.1 ABC transporter ATP-binding protein [Acidimicrobiaceae bacterium]MYA74093.1 ABC transporter ATP-binding protein [Acidimicrobiaceae bacterium]MYC42388.1 ABC transporter ATP-binding protein [Acidimicrobiaceae bacterium]